MADNQPILLCSSVRLALTLLTIVPVCQSVFLCNSSVLLLFSSLSYVDAAILCGFSFDFVCFLVFSSGPLAITANRLFLCSPQHFLGSSLLWPRCPITANRYFFVRLMLRLFFSLATLSITAQYRLFLCSSLASALLSCPRCAMSTISCISLCFCFFRSSVLLLCAIVENRRSFFFPQISTTLLSRFLIASRLLAASL
ncbi:hypothetical protein AVEN_37303-1 [Araneus ventricosus]|uniref:Uncharacterized protein n=1 Tax=Araneus ventricosus TaxID=182803 RepID=A0A4Y2UAV1_ARAVE|nr:hypothetical protein AVEN_37303-1 [Araneus ventricosus]